MPLLLSSGCAKPNLPVSLARSTGPSPGPEMRMATLRFLLKRFVAQRLLGLAVVVTLASASSLIAVSLSDPAQRSATSPG